MTDDPHTAAIERIERALARIERAGQVRAFATDSLERRHTMLKARMADAIVAIDALIAREAGAD
ncbi:hypothetical protein ASG37_02945 [Sphingomonas sp. Leaf407]|uniref:hypothetical protein n=1 Tax=unclassified Sphingomonas TaxID=196159 RepID=UPI0006FAE345|nr:MULTISPECIES: hypothetical protein [unclassified Sphingomonas]KQN40752.1 hypothetical protein ASE97_02970 [Sphingomonas sp. Leaf42]KQT30107.1 hypothetical protein ASG37_02945 [Sphingomonas sp. Leaf407]